MATIIAKIEVTLTRVIDVASNMRYYKLQSSTAAAPSKPTVNPPSGWSTTEPSYTSGSTNTLYFVDCTIYSNGTFKYSDVSKSSSYEAAKEAYNKAQAAQDSIDDMEIGGRNLLRGSKTLKNDNKDFYGSTKLVDGEYGDFVCSKTSSAWAGPCWDISTIMERYDLKPGDTLTYSIMVMVDFVPDKPCSFTLYRAATAAMTVTTFTMEKDKWYKLSKTFTLDEGSATATRTRLETNYYKTTGDLTTDYVYDFEDGYMYFAAPKFEKGTKATDWTPAPEDLETEVAETRQELTDYQSSITNELGTIRTDASETTTILNGSIKELSDMIGDIGSIGAKEEDDTLAKIIRRSYTWIEQNSDSILATVGKDLVTSADLNSKVTETVNSERSRLETYLRFDANGLELGKSNSDFIAALTNTMLAFRQYGIDVAYISNLALYITQAIIKERLVFGAGRSDKQQFVWSFGDTGTLDLTYEAE